MTDLSYVDVEDLLNAVEVRGVTRSGEEVTFSCPLAAHTRGDSRPSARMNTQTTAWICHSCGARGNAINFLAEHKSIPYTVAKRLLEERYGGALTAPIDGLSAEIQRVLADRPIEDERTAPEEEWMTRFYVDWVGGPLGMAQHYMLDRGFSTRALTTWEIGHDHISDRIAIPVHDVYNRLIGFKGRAWRDDQQPKYLILGDAPQRQPRYGFDTYRKSEHVYGLNRKQGGIAIIVEGELNVVSMWQKGWANAVGVAGSEFSQTQADLIISRSSEVIVYFDDDDAGRKGTEKIVEKLKDHIPLSIVDGAKDDAAASSAEEILGYIDNAKDSLRRQLDRVLSTD